MTMSLRARILITVLPLLALLALVGGAAVVLLYALGGRIDAILRENYDSVIYMERLKEDLERIDSSFQFALAGEEEKALQDYRNHWQSYREFLAKEKNNITLPGEAELVERLLELSENYRRAGDAFYARPSKDPRRHQDYFRGGGLLAGFRDIKGVADDILRLNQENMEQASADARAAARSSLIGFAVSLTAAALLAGWLAWRTVQAILRPIREVTRSALAIGHGLLDQVVPVMSRDELGKLAQAFNTMARQLRQYRETSYARLLRAQRTSQATIDAFPGPVLVIDPEEQVEMANPAAQRLLGIAGKRDDQPGQTWQAPEGLREPLLQALQGLGPYLPEGLDRALLFRVHNQDRFFLPRVLPIQDPYRNSLGAAVILEDVTRYQLLDQIKSDLVATVSHELKTPLTSMRLAHHLLLEEAAGPLTPKQTELLVDARDNAERLLGMVNKLLDLAQLEEGRQHLDIRGEMPAALLHAAADAVRARADAKEISLVVEAGADLPAVAVDPHRLGHALLNLLDNALTHTGRGGRITLSAAAAGKTIVLTVTDSGRGIEPEHLPHVFERFFRIPGQTQTSGTGLGLAIVREIVRAHGGTVTCTSSPGAGSAFRLELPVWTGMVPTLGEPKEFSGVP